MELLRTWILTVTVSALVISGADALMPEGAVKRVGKLTGGLILVLGLLQPLAGLDYQDLYDLVNTLPAGAVTQESLTRETADPLEGLIEEELSAYSMDKARQNGLSCSIQVTCAAEEGGIWLPKDIKIYGVLTQQEKQLLIRLLIEDLGVDSAQIIFQEGGS